MFMIVMKLILLPIVVGLADAMIADVYFPSIWSIIATGVVLAVVGLLMEAVMLRRGTLWITTAADWVVGAAGVYWAQFLFPDAFSSVTGAILAGGLIALAEYFPHRTAIRDAASFR